MQFIYKLSLYLLLFFSLLLSFVSLDFAYPAFQRFDPPWNFKLPYYTLTELNFNTQYYCNRNLFCLVKFHTPNLSFSDMNL